MNIDDLEKRLNDIHNKKDELNKDLKVLPGNENFKKKVKKTLCPKGAPVKSFSVVAIDKELKFNPNTEDEIEVDIKFDIEFDIEVNIKFDIEFAVEFNVDSI